jgi:pyrimidine-nucleoside phosphorylase
MVDLIEKKKLNLPLSHEEISFVVKGYTGGTIPDYQMSAFLMAIYFNGMTPEETADLTMEMANSGDQVDLSSIPGIKVDKHSTGGVGDKTSLIVGPIVASCGVPIAKMSGRGLGHTGGTIDKLESIPGYQTNLSKEVFLKQVQQIGISLVGQSGNLAPADKKIYALRDTTATVNQISLIASSIMSKKIAAGADAILLDVKTGSGAFMESYTQALQLAKEMISIGEQVGRTTHALITNMDVPLGKAIGNSLEVIEAVETLKGNGPEDLEKICVELAASMLYLAKKGSREECSRLAKDAVSSGAAFEKLKQLVTAQHGDVSYLEHPEKFPAAAIQHDYRADQSGYLTAMNAKICGNISCILGAGRETKESEIDLSAGIYLHKKPGDWVQDGDVIATFYTSAKEKADEAQKLFSTALQFSSEPPHPLPLILAHVSKDKTEIYQ